MSIEIPPSLQWVSYLAGSKWPQGDEDGLWRIGEHWHASATEMSDLIPDLNRVRNETMSVITGETADKAAADFALLFDGDYAVDKLVDAMGALGEMARQAGTQLEASKIEILVGLAMSAAEILYAIAMAPWTFGASMAWIPPIEALTIAAIRTLFNQLLRALVRKAVEALAKTTVSRLVRAAAKEGVEEIAQELITNLAIQQYQVDKGHKDKIDWNDVGNAAKGAAAGGVAAGLVHGPAFAALGGKHGHGGVGNALAGAGASYGAELAGGVAGALAAGSNLDAGEIFAGGVLGGLSGGIESSHGHGGGEHGEDGPHGAPVGLDGGKSHAFDPDDEGSDDKSTGDKGFADKGTDEKGLDAKGVDDTDHEDIGDFGYPDALPAYLRHDPDGSPPPFEQHQSGGTTNTPSDVARESNSVDDHPSPTTPTGGPGQDSRAEGSAQSGPQQGSDDGQAGQPVTRHDPASSQGEQTGSPQATRDGSSGGSVSHPVDHGSPSEEPSPGQTGVTAAEHPSGSPDSDVSAVQRDPQPAQNPSQVAEHTAQHAPAVAPQHAPADAPTDTAPTHAGTPAPASPAPADGSSSHGHSGSPDRPTSSPGEVSGVPQPTDTAPAPPDSALRDGPHDSVTPSPGDHQPHVESATPDSRGEPSRSTSPSAESDVSASGPTTTPQPSPANPSAAQPAPAVPTGAAGPTTTAVSSASQPNPAPATAAPASTNTGIATPAPSAAATPSTTNSVSTNPPPNPGAVSNPGVAAKSVSAGLGSSNNPAPTAVSNTAGSTASPSSRSHTDDPSQLVVGMISTPPAPSPGDRSGLPTVAKGGSRRSSKATPDKSDVGSDEERTDPSADHVSSLAVSGLPDDRVGDASRTASDESQSSKNPVRDVLPTSTQTVGEVRGWIGDVNHDGDPSVPPAGERLTNCGPTTWAVFDRLSGIDSFGRAHTERLRAQDVGDATGLPLRGSDSDGIATRLRDAGAGAHTVVVAQFDNGVAHSFNALFDGEQVWAVDGQHGTVTAWPPQLDRPGNPVTNWYVGTPADRVSDHAAFDRHGGDAHDLTVTGNGSSHPVVTAVPDADHSGTSDVLAPFDPRSKQLNATQRAQLNGLADDLVERARQQHDDHRGGLTVRAEGGGNGGRRSAGPDVVGRLRAGAALDYLRTQLEQKLQSSGLPSDMVTVSTEPTSRGASLRPELVGSEGERRRMVVLTVHERPPALDQTVHDPHPSAISEAERKEVLGRLAAGDVVSLVHETEVGDLESSLDTVRGRLRESFPDRHDHVDDDLANMVALLENSRITVNFRIDQSIADMLTEGGEQAVAGETSQNTLLNGWQRGPMDGVAELRDTAERMTGQYGGHQNVVGHESADVVAARQRINTYLTRESEDFQPSARPRYGALDYERSTTGAAPGYGGSFLILKEHVKHRATFTANDSMQGSPAATTIHGMAQLLARTHDDDFRRIHQLATTGEGFERAKDRHGSDFSKDQNYLEAQLHTPIDFFRDVEAVSIDASDTRGLDAGQHRWVRQQLADYGQAHGVRIELRDEDMIIRDLVAARAAYASGSGGVPAAASRGGHDDAPPPRDSDDDSDVIDWSDDSRSDLEDVDDPEATTHRQGSASPNEDALSDSSSILRGFVSGLPDDHGGDDVRSAGEHAGASSSGGGMPPADRSGASLHLPFDRGNKGVAAEHDQMITAFLDDVVADARRRLADGGPAAAVHVRGGGNGGLFSRGAGTVGMQRAVEARAVLQREIQTRLERDGLPRRLVSFPEPTTRGKILTDDIPGTDSSARRRMVVAHIADQEPAADAREPMARGGDREPETNSPMPVDGDGFVVDADGVSHWGRYGASGLLLRARGFDGTPMVLLQRRAQWSHQGGTWGLPGGARNLDETEVQAALRETHEETGIQGDRVGVRAQLVTARAPGIDWTYSTVIADARYPLRTTSNEEGALRWVPVEDVAALDLHPGLRDSWDGLRSQLDDHPMPSARPSAQLDHTINPLSAGHHYGTANDEEAIHYRDDDELLYREDDRPPEVIFEEGFGVHPQFRHNGYMAHFISTTRNPQLGFLQNQPEGRRVFRYTIDAPGGVDVNRTGGIAPEAYQQEISFPGGIRRENILSAVEILPPAEHLDDAAGPQPVRYGPEALNEHFNPDLPNVGAPPLFQGAIGGRRDLDDVRSVSSDGSASEIEFRRASDLGDETDYGTRSVPSEHGDAQDDTTSDDAGPGVVSGLPGDGGADVDLRHGTNADHGPLAEPRVTRSALPISALTHDDVEHWIGDVNNDGNGPIPPVGERLTNCGPTTLTVFDRLSGISSFGRAHPARLRAEDVGEATGLPLHAVDVDGVAEHLRGTGAGAHTVVVAQFGNGLAHSFNALFDGHGVWAIDGQHGTVTAWPPALGRPGNPVTRWFAGTASARPADAHLAETSVSGLGGEQPAPHSAAESSTMPTGRTGDAEPRPLHVPFDPQAKVVSAQHSDRITQFAADVVAEARRRHDAGQPGVAVTVEGGGNGGRRGDGADAVGVLRAHAVVDAIRPQVQTLLRHGGLSGELVTFPSPTTRGKALPEGVPGADKGQRRRTVVARIESQDSSGSEVTALQDDSGPHVTPSAETQRHVLGTLAAGDVVGLQYAEDMAAGDGWKATLQDRLRAELRITDPEQARNDLEKMIEALENSRVTVNFDAGKWFAEFVANPDNPPDAYLNSWERGVRPGGDHTKGVLDSVEQSTGGYSRDRHGMGVDDEQVDAARGRIQQYLSDRGSEDFVASGRPRYGAVDYSNATAGPAEGYGTSFLVVREHVKHRALFLSGDSFAQHGLRATTYSHIGKVLTDSSQGQLRGLHQHATTGGRGPVTAGQGVYFEAQLYTPVRFDRDVAEVHLDMRELSAIRDGDVSSALAALRRFAESQGVELVVRQWSPTLSLPFAEGSKAVDAGDHRVDAFVKEVVKMAVARSEAGSHGLEMHVDGGGNGNIFGRGATASGLERADAVREAIRRALDVELPKWRIPSDFVSIAEPMSRGRALGSEVAGDRRDARRRVDVRVTERPAPTVDVAAPPAPTSSAPPEERGDEMVTGTESPVMGTAEVLDGVEVQAPSHSDPNLGGEGLLTTTFEDDVPAADEYAGGVDVSPDDADHVGGTEHLDVVSGPESPVGDVMDDQSVVQSDHVSVEDGPRGRPADADSGLGTNGVVAERVAENDSESVYFSADSGDELPAEDEERGTERAGESEVDHDSSSSSSGDSDTDSDRDTDSDTDSDRDSDTDSDSDSDSDSESGFFTDEGGDAHPTVAGDYEPESERGWDTGGRIDAETATDHGLFGSHDGGGRRSASADHKRASTPQETPELGPSPVTDDADVTDSDSEAAYFSAEEDPASDADGGLVREPERGRDAESETTAGFEGVAATGSLTAENDSGPKVAGASGDVDGSLPAERGADRDARGAHESPSPQREQGLPVAAASSDASRPATPPKADSTDRMGKVKSRTDSPTVLESHDVHDDSTDGEPSETEQERAARAERRAGKQPERADRTQETSAEGGRPVEHEGAGVQGTDSSREDLVAAHVHDAVQRAIGGRAGGDLETGGAGPSRHRPSWWQRAWHATSMHEDVAHHDDQRFWDLLEHLTNPGSGTGRSAIADMRDAMLELRDRINTGSALPQDHPLAGDADVERAYRVMRTNAGPLVNSALESFSVLAAAPDRSWQGRAEAALTAVAMAGALGAPYSVPILEGDPNYTALLVSAHAKILPRLVGLAAYPRVNRRLFWEYARDAPLLWLSELPYLAELRFPQLGGALPPGLEHGGTPEHGSGPEPDRIPTLGSRLWVAGNTLFAVGYFAGLGYGPSVPRLFSDRSPDQRALANGDVPLPSSNGRPTGSGPLTHEEFGEQVARAANGLQVVLEAQRAFRAAGGQLSVNLAAQIGHAAEDVRALQELASRLQGTPRETMSFGEWAATGLSTEANPDFKKKAGFVAAHALPHWVAIGAGWTLNAPSGGSATADYFYAGVLRAGGAMLDPHASAEDAKEIFNNLTSELLGNLPIDLAVIAYHSRTGGDFWENPVVQGVLTAYLGVFSATYAGRTGEWIADRVGEGIEHFPNPGPPVRRFSNSVRQGVSGLPGLFRDYVRQNDLWVRGRGAEAGSGGAIAPTVVDLELGGVQHRQASNSGLPAGGGLRMPVASSSLPSVPLVVQRGTDRSPQSVDHRDAPTPAHARTDQQPTSVGEPPPDYAAADDHDVQAVGAGHEPAPAPEPEIRGGTDSAAVSDPHAAGGSDEVQALTEGVEAEQVPVQVGQAHQVPVDEDTVRDAEPKTSGADDDEGSGSAITSRGANLESRADRAVLSPERGHGLPVATTRGEAPQPSIRDASVRLADSTVAAVHPASDVRPQADLHDAGDPPPGSVVLQSALTADDVAPADQPHSPNPAETVARQSTRGGLGLPVTMRVAGQWTERVSVVTPSDLERVVERIGGRDQVVAAEDPRLDPAACTVLLSETLTALHPDRFSGIPAAGRTLDDSVLDGRPVSRLIGGATPVPVTSWGELDARLHLAAGPTGHATALILVRHSNAVGHAVGAHRFPDGRIAYFDLHRAPGHRVLLGERPGLSLARASAVFVDGRGRDVSQPQEHASVVDALVDPAGDNRYGRGGFEVETGFELDISPEEATRLGNTPLARSPHFTLVLDKVAGKAIVEIVSRPAAMLPGERPRWTSGVDHDEVFRNVRSTIERLRASTPGATLGEIFAGTNVDVTRRFEGTAVTGEPLAGRSVAHYSVGVRLDAMHEFMRFADANSMNFEPNSEAGDVVEPGKRHLHSALRFGDEVAAAFAGLDDAHASRGMLDQLATHDHELAGVRGFMAASYTQVAAFVHFYVMQPGMLAKNHTLIALRMSLGAMRASLPRAAASWLDEHSEQIEDMFTRRMNEDYPEIAIAAQDKEMTVLDATWKTLDFTARDYLRNATKQRPTRPVDQYEALGIRTRFATMDGDLAVGELRFHGRHDATVADIEDYYREMHSTVNELDERARRRRDVGGQPAVVRNGRFHLPFDSGVKRLTASQRAQLAGFAGYVVELAADRHAAGAPRPILHAQGGGNGGVRSRGAEAVGLQRAGEAIDAVRDEIESQLDRRGVPRDAVVFADPTSRGNTADDYAPSSTRAAHRAVTMWMVTDDGRPSPLPDDLAALVGGSPGASVSTSPVAGSTEDFLRDLGGSARSSTDRGVRPWLDSMSFARSEPGHSTGGRE